MATEAVIEICDLVKRFPNAPRPALGPLSLAIKKGDLLAVVGPSGSGKTTLLRLIAGFECPDEGSVVIDGHTVAEGRPRGKGGESRGSRLSSSRRRWVEPEARGVGMVFQDYALFPHLTVAQNIAFGLPKRDSRARVRELLELVGLAEFSQRYPHELSGGEQQRVALARSLATDPKVLLLDEPFSNLDADLRPKMRAELKLLLQRLNCTTVFVTHDREEAFELADQVAVLNAGRLEQTDFPERLYREPATRFVAEFMGQANFLTGRVRENCIETEIGCFEKRVLLPHGALVDVMLRPEEIELFESSEDSSKIQRSKGAEPTDLRIVFGEGLVVSRRYRGGVQLITVRLSSGEALHSLQPAGAHFPLAARVGVWAKTQTPTVFVGDARVPRL